jgi:hypothetical protein
MMIKYSEVTPDLIQEWKAKYGASNIFEAAVESTDGENHNYIIRTPSRTVMDATAELGSKKDYKGANKVLISNCVLAGDDQALENDGGIYGALLEELAKLQRKKTVAVKKL